MTKKERYKRVLAWFQQQMPEPQSELHYENIFQLLVAVMLSAQCTDRRVNLVTPDLFAAYPTAETMATASESDLLRFIHSVSYPNAKARHLLATAQKLRDEFAGEVPDTEEALTSLSGVGRKTAHVVLAIAFGRNTLAVDTHIFRVSRRLGLVPVSATTPLAVERELTRNLPPDVIPHTHHWLLLHGRYVCKALHPQCDCCGLRDMCVSFSQQSNNLQS